MSIYHLGLYEKSMPDTLSITEKLHATRIAGFDYLELSIDEGDEKLSRLDWNETEILKIHEGMLTEGVDIRSICLSGHRRFPLGHPDENIRTHSLVIMEKAIKLASKLGARIVQLAGYDIYYGQSTEETKQHFGNNLERAVEMAAKFGILLAFETMETPFLNSIKKAMYWIRKIDSPYLQLYPDIGNITNAALDSGNNVLSDLAFGQGSIVAIHMKESKPGIYRDLLFGEGHVNFLAVAKAAAKQGVRMFVGEFWHDGGDNWTDILRQSHDFLREVLDEAI